MGARSPGMHRGVRWAIGCVVAIAVLVSSFADAALLANASYLAVGIAAAGAAWLGALRLPRGLRLVPALIAAGLSASALGEVLWVALDAAGFDTDVSLADPAWLSSYLFLGAALVVVLVRSRPDRRDLRFVLDAVTIAVVSVLVFWRLSIDAILADTSVSVLVRVVWSSYPILDAILLALVIRILLSPSARVAIDAWFGLGGVLWLTADVAYLLWPDRAAAVVVMDAAWMVAPVLMALAAWRARDRVVPEPESSVGGGWVAEMLIAVSPLLVPPVLELAADLRGEPDRPAELLVGMLAVIVLAFVRTGYLIRSEQRALRRLEEARDEALAASEAKSLFLANMSHEIRTPLTTVLAAAELLADTDLDGAQGRLVGKVHHSADQLQSLVETILDFSRLEAGNAGLQPVAFALRDVVDDVVDVCAPKARDRGLGFAWEVDGRLPSRVLGDPLRVFQVLANLVDNAVKFTDQGRVDIRLGPGETSETVVLEVVDTGIGIDPVHHESIFDSFRQVDGTITRRHGGSGLGLAICSELCQAMGGTITVHSALGTGATFQARLPLPEAGPAAAELVGSDP